MPCSRWREDGSCSSVTARLFSRFAMPLLVDGGRASPCAYRILAGGGRIDIRAPAPVAEWRGPDDPRRAITLDQLLRMSSGLAFIESYIPDEPTDVIDMLWGKGKDDAAHFAASFPLAHPPARSGPIRAGTTNIVARLAADAAGARGGAFEAFMRKRLFRAARHDERIAQIRRGRHVHRLGRSCLRRRAISRASAFSICGAACGSGARIVPEGWVDYARTPTYQQTADQGRLRRALVARHCRPRLLLRQRFTRDSSSSSCRKRDLVLVRLGKSRAEVQDRVQTMAARSGGVFPLIA